MRIDAPLDDLFRSRSHIRVLRALDELPPDLAVSARDVGRRAGVSHPTASAILASLAQQGVVRVRRTPNADFFELNRDHVLVESIGPLLDREHRLRDELVEFLRQQIQRHVASVRAAFLFGSAARGEMTPVSDIDVAIVVPAMIEAQSVEAGMEQVAEAVRARFGNRLNYVVGKAPVDRLRRSGRPGHRLWAQIAADGVPIVPGEGESDDG
jgi:predicted nucleotidyltransferase